MFANNRRAMLVWLMLISPSAAQAYNTDFQCIERVVSQEQGDWLITYSLRYTREQTTLICQDEVAGKLEGWMSNSSLSEHAHPKWASVDIAYKASHLGGISNLISSPDDEQSCDEAVFVRLWTDDMPQPESPQLKRFGQSYQAQTEQLILVLQPAEVLHVRLYVQHRHWRYGDYNPLLGELEIKLKLGNYQFNDHITETLRQQYWALPLTKIGDNDYPEERMDKRIYFSSPGSLHLEAHIPGNQSYRFPERKVRYNTRMRLRFWYLIAPDTEGDCRARIMQYADSPTAQRSIPEGNFEVCLTRIGRWTKVEKIFFTQETATTMALDFRLCGEKDVGEVWIDDVSVEPVITRNTYP